MTVNRIVNAREGTSTLDRAIPKIVGMIGRFNGKDVTNYLQAYRAEMKMRDILEDRRLSGFRWVVTPSIHTVVLEDQAHCRNWPEFEGRLLEWYNFNDSLRLSKREFME